MKMTYGSLLLSIAPKSKFLFHTTAIFLNASFIGKAYTNTFLQWKAKKLSNAK